jgi:hypothetical protein
MTMHPLHFVHNDDATAPLSFVSPGQVKADYIQWVDWIMDTPVDTYAAHAASPFECFYPSRIGQIYGLKSNARTDLEKKTAVILDELQREGTDPFRVQADRVHERGKRFLAAIRMSDAHYQWPWCGGPPAFFEKHPEWRIRKNDGTTDWYMDYAVPEVRAHILAIIEEIAEHYPIDGLELDFMRFCHHFQRPATADQIGIMTGFIRQIRGLLDRIESTRGRTDRLVLGARIPSTLAECAPNGLDPAAWAREGLVDYVNPCQWLFADFTIPIDDYAAALKGSDCRILYSIQPRAVAEWGQPQTELAKAFSFGVEEFRALAATAYAAGAHGLHTFNVCCEFPNRREDMQTALHAMASLQSIYAGPRHYQNLPADSADSDGMSGTLRWQILRFTPGVAIAPQRFVFQTGEKGRNSPGRLAWRIFGSLPDDQWSFRLNGTMLARETVSASLRQQDLKSPGKDTCLPDHMYFEIMLPDAPPLAFRNELEITALNLPKEPRSDRVMSVLEVWIG